MGLFDFKWNDGSDSLWEKDRGFWNNIGNLGANILGGTAGFIGTGFNPLGAAAGWAGANQAYDAGEQWFTKSREGNGIIDLGTVAAGTAGFASNMLGVTAGTTFGLGGGAAAGGAAAGGGAAAAGGTGAAGAGGGMLSNLGGAATNFLTNSGMGLLTDFLQQGASSLFNSYADRAQAAQEKLEKTEYYERNKAAAAASYDAQVDTTALRFLQNDLAIRQQAFDFELTGRMARSSAVVATGASNLAGVSAREAFNDISSQTASGARRYQTQRKNAADSFYQDIANLQVARDNQVNSVLDPRQFEVSDEIKRLQQIAPWIEFGVGMLGKVGDAIGHNNNVNDIRTGQKE